MWCRAVLCAWGCAVVGPPCLLAGRRPASCWVLRCQCRCRACLVVLATAALSTCIMHDHVNGGWACSPLPHGPPPLPTPDRQGHSPRCDRMRNLNGFITQRPRERARREGEGKKRGRGREFAWGPLGAGWEKLGALVNANNKRNTSARQPISRLRRASSCSRDANEDVPTHTCRTDG